MKIEVTVPLRPVKPTKTYTEHVTFAILLGDRSGVIALFRNKRMADVVLPAIKEYCTAQGYHAPIVVDLQTGEESQ